MSTPQGAYEHNLANLGYSHLYQPPIFHFKVPSEPAKFFLHEIEVKGLVKLMAHFYRFRLLAGGW